LMKTKPAAPNVHKTLGDDLRRDLIGVLNASAGLKPKRKGERVGKVRRMAGQPFTQSLGGFICKSNAKKPEYYHPRDD
jgi:hypothetical protein